MTERNKGGRPKGDPNHQRRGKGSWGPGSTAKSFSATNQPAPEAKSAGHEIAREIRERIAARKDEILAAQLARATDPGHPQGHQAAADLLNRVMPPESKATVDMTMTAGVDAPPPETREEWLARRAREAGVVGATTGATNRSH